ncbi:glycosyltransferase family 4 protein [Azospirillum sp. sgz302134]
MISRNSARDLERMFPSVPADSTAVAYCGVDAGFRPADPAEVEAFRREHKIDRPYILMVGDRAGYEGYKNGILLFRALKAMAEAGGTGDVMVVCVGGRPTIEEEFTALAPRVPVVRLSLKDSELRLAYAGARVLVYPSRYEGFGMPIVEAMACGCPVITCANSSIVEVAGDAALFVGEDDAAGMAERLREVADPQRRADLVRRGLEQASRFTFEAMADTMARALTDAARGVAEGSLPKPQPVWNEVKRLLVENQELKQTLAAVNAQAAVPVAPGVVVPDLGDELARCGRDLAAAREALESIQRSPFWLLRRLVVGSLRRAGVRRRG